MLATIRCPQPRHRGTVTVDDGCRQRGEIRVSCERCEVTHIDGELDTLRPVRISPFCFSWERN